MTQLGPRGQAWSDVVNVPPPSIFLLVYCYSAQVVDEYLKADLSSCYHWNKPLSWIWSDTLFLSLHSSLLKHRQSLKAVKMKSFWSQDVDHFRLVLFHLRFAFPNEKDGISHCVLIPGCQIAAPLCHASVHLIQMHKAFFSICVKHKAFLPERLGLGPKTSRWGFGNYCWHFGFVQNTNSGLLGEDPVCG